MVNGIEDLFTFNSSTNGVRIITLSSLKAGRILDSNEIFALSGLTSTAIGCWRPMEFMIFFLFGFGSCCSKGQNGYNSENTAKNI